MPNYLDDLNIPQRTAVTHPNGPLMIIAGAGSGKTRVLTYRIAWLLEQGVDPFNIMALTFTNKAAGEMRARIEKIIGTDARNLWMGTFHSVFARILRSEGRLLGYTPNFSIYDTDDSKSLIKSIVKDFSLDDKLYRPNSVLSRISNAKNSLVSWEAYLENAVLREEDIGARMPELGRIYQAYQLRAFKANAMDFDDLLFNTNVLFRDHLDVLNKYQHKFKHVLVDEFQDTNVSQYLITRKLSAVHQNICVVGDDAQSIYAFRGANIQNILNFKKDYPELTVVKLEENYRSTGTIVNAANSIIKKNKDQLEKTVFTKNLEGEKIELIKAATDNEEGKSVANRILEQKMKQSLRNSDFAILYRTNAQSRAFEEALRKLNIKYRIIGGLSFYQRKEIKDLLAYLRFVVNEQDTEALKRIINYPKRGIGDTSQAKIIVTAEENGVGVWDVLEGANTLFSGKTLNGIEAFVHLIKSYRLLLNQGKDAFYIAEHVAKSTGILRELHSDRTVEGMARYENLQELLSSIKEYVESEETVDSSLSAFLQNVSLLTNADQEDEDGDNDRVTLMTIHGSKGLEYKHVFVVGLEENLFPSQMMLQSRSDLEEERRLFYVAVTRAEQFLTLSYADSRYHYGRLNYCEPSRFLLEIEPSFIKMAAGATKNFSELDLNLVSTFANRKERTLKNLKPVAKAKPAGDHTPSSDFVASKPEELQEGFRVEHQKFGFGEIKKLENSDKTLKATVVFDKVGEKTLLLSFAKLRVVE